VELKGGKILIHFLCRARVCGWGVQQKKKGATNRSRQNRKQSKLQSQIIALGRVIQYGAWPENSPEDAPGNEVRWQSCAVKSTWVHSKADAQSKSEARNSKGLICANLALIF
jgi:hypothetical protein